MRSRWVAGILVLACGGPVAGQQVFERDTRVVGPKGKAIDRSVRIERTPGAVTREIDIRRPGGEFHRSVTMPTGRGPGPGPGPRPMYGPGPRGPLVVERNVYVERGGGNGWVAPAVGVAGFAAGALIGSALSRPAVPPPAPVVVAPLAPVYVPAPVVAAPVPVYVPAPMVAQPVPTPAPAPVHVGVDNVAAEVNRLNSWSGTTRVDAIKILGRLNDPRAVPPLIQVLRDDYKDEVREHAAWALGTIGDPSARPYLEVASTSDSKRKVREASILALQRLDAVAAAEALPPPGVANSPASTSPGDPPPPPSPALVPRSMQQYQVTAGPHGPDPR